MRLSRALIVALVTVFAVEAGPAEAQLWKPQPKKPAAAAPTKPTRAKPARAPRVRRASKPTRPAPRRAVVRDDAPARDRDRARAPRADELPDFDDSPVITVEMPTRGER
jgi:hypothetical protein